MELLSLLPSGSCYCHWVSSTAPSLVFICCIYREHPPSPACFLKISRPGLSPLTPLYPPAPAPQADEVTADCPPFFWQVSWHLWPNTLRVLCRKWRHEQAAFPRTKSSRAVWAATSSPVLELDTQTRKRGAVEFLQTEQPSPCLITKGT